MTRGKVLFFLIGLVIGGVFLYLAARGIDLSNVLSKLEHMDYKFLVPALLVNFSLPALRALRLKTLLRVVKPLPLWYLIKVNAVGYFFITALPLRLGELYIPYQTSRDNEMSLSSIMAAVLVERLLDLVIVLLALLFLVLFFVVPTWLITGGVRLSIFFAVIFICAIVAFWQQKRLWALFERLVSILPQGIQNKVTGFTSSFLKSLKAFAESRTLLKVGALSCLIFLVYSFNIYFLFLVQGFSLPLSAVLFVMVFVVIGISLPTAPMMIGNIQYAIILALAIFGIAKDEAFIFANVYYVLGIGATCLLGIVFLPFMRTFDKGFLKGFESEEIAGEKAR